MLCKNSLPLWSAGGALNLKGEKKQTDLRLLSNILFAVTPYFL